MADFENEGPESVNLTDILPENDKPSPPDLAQKAIALKHERGEGQAPTIVASGQGAIAEQILQLAFANGVKVREDADLAEILSHIDIDSPIPLEAYSAVAEILSYVYQANARHNPKRNQTD